MVRKSAHVISALLSVALLWPSFAHAQVMTSTDYMLDSNIGASFGGQGTSTDYGLTDTGGQSAAAAGSSADYQLASGFIGDLPQSIELSVLPSGTYAYWPFDSGTGATAYDMSTNEDNGSLINSPTWTTGEVGDAITFNGSSQYMATSNSLAGPNTFTAEFWFKTASSYGSGGELLGFGSSQTGASTTNDRVIYLTNAGKVTFGVDPSGTDETIQTTSAYNDGAWHYVAVSLGSAGMQLYVDGTLQAQNAAYTTGASDTGYWRMGYDSLTGWPSAPTSNYVAATVDEAHIYTRDLATAEIAADYSAGQNGLNSAFTLPNITPGTSQTYSVSAVVRTDAPGYGLYMQAPSPLTRVGGGATFPSISGTIASPIAWTEGTTKGFGFTVTGGHDVESSWGTSPNYNYAAVPTTSTEFHDRLSDGQSLLEGAPETTTIQYRADASPTQLNGTYSTQIIYTATMLP